MTDRCSAPGGHSAQLAWRSLDLSRPALIEASAGTGKTYQLAYLVLRLVLGLGERQSRILHGLEELLVVTFTRAAAAELRTRIMELLAQAEQALRERRSGREPGGYSPDLCAVLAEVSGRENECLQLLTEARSHLHEAMICTIHAFCYRVLQDYALEAGVDGTLTRISGGALGELQLEAARAVIRTQLYPPEARELMFGLLGGRCAIAEVKGIKGTEYGCADPDRLLELALNKCARARVVSGSAGALKGRLTAYALHGCRFIDPGRSLEENIRALQEQARLPACVQELKAHAADLEGLADFSKAANGGEPVPGPLYARLPEVDKRKKNPPEFKKDAKCLLNMCRKLLESDGPVDWLHLDLDSCLSTERFIARLPAEDAYRKDFVHPEKLLQLEEWLKDLVRTLAALITEMQCLLAIQVLERCDAELERRSLTSDDDVIVRLSSVLARKDQQGMLARRLRERWPVALIDECQDTDPLQAAIFGQIYAGGSADGGSGSGSCVLIGDPKQAIYSFRGADVHAYLRYAQRIRGDSDSDSSNTAVLGTCYRSAPGLVAAVNALFGDDEDALPGGGVTALGLEGLAFTPLQPRADEGQCLGFRPGAGTRWAGEHRQNRDVYVTRCLPPPADPQTDAKPQGRTAAELKPREICARFCALDIQALLGDAPSELSTGNVSRPLRQDDIAVLVRNREEAALIRRALAELGLATAYESDDSSVLRSRSGIRWHPTPEATNIAYLMAAMCGRVRLRTMRRLLGCSLLRHTAAEVQTLSADERAMEQLASDLEMGADLWRRRGFLPAFMDFMRRRGALARLRSGYGGWRELSVYLHISELLQAGHDGCRSPGEQYRAFVREINGQQEQRDEELLRVRRADQRPLLRVLTMHKAKGREFALVFLPFIAAFVKPRSRSKGLELGYSLQEQRRELLVGAPAGDQFITAADLERQEELRLLYVALTRARAACFIYTAAAEAKTEKSARAAKSAEDEQARLPVLARLLDVKDQNALLDLLQERSEIFQVSTWDGVGSDGRAASDGASAASAPDPAQLAPARRLEVPPDRSFDITSYSTLAGRLHGRSGADAEAAADDAEGEVPLTAADPTADLQNEIPDEEDPAAAIPADEADAGTPTRFDFPRGKAAGDFLHRLLQQVHFPACDRDDDYLTQQAQAALRRRSAAGTMLRRWGTGDEVARVTALTEWLRDIVHAPLLAGSDGTGCRLSDLAPGEWVAEMEYCLPVAGLPLGAVNELCRRAGAQAAAALELPEAVSASPPQSGRSHESAVRGYLRGALDVVARLDCGQDPRYFVIDYKSTHLGCSPDDYAPPHLLCDMLSPAHRYDLQYMLYTLALYRQLCLRRGLKRDRAARTFYEDQIGGVLYLYLRGLQAGDPQHGIFRTRVDFDLLHELDQLCAGGEGV